MTNNIKHLIGFGALFFACLVILFNPILFIRFIPKLSGDNAVYEFDMQQKYIALTIDDGPHPTITPLILDLLKKNDSKATFFLTGKNIEEHSEIVNRIVAEGHEIGNHMEDHNVAILLDSDQFYDQLLTTHRIILQKQGQSVWLRPGGGFYNQEMAATAKSLGYQISLGSVYPYDASIPEEQGGAKFMQRFIIRNSRPGSIIIVHDGRIRTVNVLQNILPSLIHDGYQLVTLSELDSVSSEHHP